MTSQNRRKRKNEDVIDIGINEIDPVTAVRGSSTDWSPENSDELVQKHKRYSKNILAQQQSGSPDFDSMFSE